VDRASSDAHAKPDALVLVGKTRPNGGRAQPASRPTAENGGSLWLRVRPSLARPERRMALAASLSHSKEANVMSDAHQAYVELQQRMREALRSQNPQWVEPDGSSPICDDYERRLAELLDLVTNE